MPEIKSQPAVGIDLGTTFSTVAYLDAEGRPQTIRNCEGDLTTPSAVFFDHKRPLVGMEAVEAGLLEPDRLAQFAKRDVGEKFYQKQIAGKNLPAEVIEALVLRKLKADAELKLGPISEAVITVPAFFNEPCRKATQDAGRLAGLKVLDIINEPTAAAITYGVEQGFLKTDGTIGPPETVLVYDLGGGTFDVTVMEIENGYFNTIATAGDVYLGGIDWDSRIVDLIAEAFVRKHGIDPRDDPQVEQELLRKANQTKHALTQRESVTVAFAHDGRRMRTEISAKQFTDRCVDLVERTLMTVQLVLDDADIDWSDLTRLILVGGSTRMPMIRDELQRLSGMELDRTLSPDEAVSHGAALYAGMLLAGKHDKSGISVSNVNSHDLGVLAVDPRSERPRRKIMIPRNSQLPASKMVRFRTHADNQANVKIQIVEGGDKRGSNATPIGKCVVTDIPEGTPKGTNVDVRFDYTADGRLTVHASLPELDRKITMALNRASGLTDEQIGVWAQRLDEGFSDAMLAKLPATVEPIDQDPAETESLASPASVSPFDPEEFAVAEDPGEKTHRVGPKKSSTPASTTVAKDTPVPASRPASSNPAAKRESAPLSQPAATRPAATKPAATTQPAPAKAAAVQPAATKAAAILNLSKSAESKKPVASPAAKQPQEQRPAAKSPIKIEVAGPSSPPSKLTADDAKSLPSVLGAGTQVVREKPELELSPKDASTAAKADKNDLAALASLAGKSDRVAPSPAEIPLIVTDSKPPAGTPKVDVDPQKTAKSKKSGGLFGRKHK